jgi:enamine deaminase RidA (YjgF/YER057c/UK114 family)
MNATIKSVIFWVVFIVVGVAIWHLSSKFERVEAERVAAAQPAASQGGAVDPEARLKELGITLPASSPPIANYVNAVQVGNLLYLAGKGPLPQDGKEVVGRLGKDMTIEQGYQAARSTAIAHISVLKKELGDLKRVVRIVKVLGMVNSDPAFTQQPAVVNGYSDLMVAVFGDKGKHARSSVGMATLPGGIPVEVEVIVEISPVR